MEESDSSTPDASADSPWVQATFPDSAGATVDDKKDGGTDKKTADDATPETADGSVESVPEGSTESAPEGSTEASAKCVPGAPPANNGCITDTSGVFVATVAKGGSDTAGTGSMTQPFATITRALANLGTSPAIYVCGGGYVDQITVTVPVSIYGGLTCAGGKWAYLASAVALETGSLASFALQIAVTTGAVDLEDMEIEGATAAAGESSIAAWVNASSNVSLHRVKVVGGIGGAGANAGGAAPNYTAATAPVGGAGTGDVALGTPILAAVGGVNTCVDGTTSHGGFGGGSSQSPYTGIGTSGLPSYGTLPFAPDPATNTGAAASSPANLVCATTFPGSDGEGGGKAGATAVAPGGWLLSASTWVPSSSGKGANGGPGQGGGGGNVNNGDSSGNGAGGGGAGGCGGAGGLAGTSGGASFALLSIDSTVTLDQCTITGGLAGNGGNGSEGQPGQGPGTGGPGGEFDTTCFGARGGYGQGGGGGAGGSAGPSAALAYVGTKPVYGSDTTIAAFDTAATPGTGGAAGASDSALPVGDANLAAKGAAGAATAPVALMLLPTQ